MRRLYEKDFVSFDGDGFVGVMMKKHIYCFLTLNTYSTI